MYGLIDIAKIENLEKGNGVFKFYGKTRNRYEEFDLLEE